MGLITVPSEFCKLQYKKGTAWKTIPGITSYRESGGEPPERDDVAFEGASKRVGHPRVPSIECPAFFQPVHQAWQDMYKYARDKTVVYFRLRTPEEVIVNASTITFAIATDGAVTIAGTGTIDFAQAHFGPGLSFKFVTATGVPSSKYWHIEEIDTEASPVTVTVSPAPTTAITAATASIVLARVSRGGLSGFPASVRLASLMDLSAEASAQTTLTLSPRGFLPAWEAVE